MKESAYREILQHYRYLLGECINVISSYLMDYLGSKIFLKNDNIRKILTEEVKKYFANAKNELKIYNFLLRNKHKLYIDDIYGLLEILLNEFKLRFEYIEQVFGSLETAIGMECDYKFYLPQKKSFYIDKEKLEKYLQYVKGFNLERVYGFLSEVNICDEKFINEQDVKIFPTSPINTDFYGMFETGKIVIPKVSDEESALIAVHELVHYVLVKKEQEIQNDKIVNREDLPIFYELLYQERNSFSKLQIHTTEIALKLLKSYQEEPLNIQIEKTRKLYKEYGI